MTKLLGPPEAGTQWISSHSSSPRSWSRNVAPLPLTKTTFEPSCENHGFAYWPVVSVRRFGDPRPDAVTSALHTFPPSASFQVTHVSFRPSEEKAGEYSRSSAVVSRAGLPDGRSIP